MINRLVLIASIAAFVSAASFSQTTRPETREGPARQLARVYDVRDLIAGLDVPPDSSGPLPPTKQHPLVRAIRAFMPPPLNDAYVQPSGGQIIVSVLPRQHAWLDQFLDAQRTKFRGTDRWVPRDDAFRVETQCFETSVEQAASIGIKDGAPVHVTDDAALAVVRKDIAEMKGAVVGPLETTEVVMGRPGHDETFTELTYVKAWEKRTNVEPGNQTLTLPVLESEREGTFIDVLVVAMPEDRFGCLLEARTSRIAKPVASRNTPDGPVAAPVVTTTSIEAKATFDGKMTILFPGPPRDGRVPFVTVKVWRKRPDGEAK